jgi:hypothetical protein
LHSDGRAVCEPAGAADAAYFTDPACTMPAAAIATTAPATLARLVEPSGCASYHRLGAASAAVYRLDGAACTAVDPPVGSGVFALGEVVDLPVVTRSLDTAAGRRLSHIVYAVGDPDVRFVDAPLLDATTGTECTPRMLRDTIRCVPATVAAMTLFTAGCTQPIRVAELAQHACAPIEYASANRPFQLLPIGDAIAASLFQTTGGTCQPYVGAPDSALHAVGAPVDLTMFEAAIYFGERAP